MTTQTHINIHLLAFGQIADIIGQSTINYSTPDTLLAFKTKIENDYPLLSKIVYRIAINKKMALEDTDLHEADELALLPPFSGG
jgi:molybdopterin synthase sulfur carrier subunit